MIDEAEGKIEVFQQNVATWFDGAMDRTSGAYKRWIHRLTFWAGFRGRRWPSASIRCS